MKRLLLATDFSSRSRHALDRAVQLAAQWRSQITLLHVVDEDLPGPLRKTHVKTAQQTLKDHIGDQRIPAALKIVPKVVVGRVFRAIVETARKDRSDLIVMGSHRIDYVIDPWREVFGGTTIERVLRAGVHSVLLVRKKPRGPYSNVVVGVDFSEPSRHALTFAMRLSPQSRFAVVHAHDVPFAGFLGSRAAAREVFERDRKGLVALLEHERSRVQKDVRPTAANFLPVLERGGAVGVLHHQVNLLKPDLVVLGTHGRTGVSHWFLGSVTEVLLATLPCDVLAVRPRRIGTRDIA